MALSTYTLNDGTTLPQVGFGTHPLKGDDGIAAIVSALENGYRLLDSAVNYENEEETGEALRRSGLYPEAWQALVEAQAAGLVRTIGVSNFTPEHLRRIIDDTGVTPAVNQVEMHPYLPQTELREVHAELGIQTEAWSPLGKSPTPFEEEPVAAAARAHGVTPAQVVLRWHLQLDSLPLPKAAGAERQRENLDLDGFTLSDDEMAAITDLGRADGRRFSGDPDTHEEM